MKKIKMQCENCGAVLKRRSNDLYVCEHCDTEYLLDDEAITVNYNHSYRNEARIKEIELKNRILDEEIRKNKVEQESYEQWKKNRNLWVLVLGIVMLLDYMSGAELFSYLLAIWMFVGGAYIYYTRPLSKDNRYRNRYGDNLRMPWYHTIFGIFVFGCFTGSIYWFIGPFLRKRWKRTYGRN